MKILGPFGILHNVTILAHLCKAQWLVGKMFNHKCISGRGFYARWKSLCLKSLGILPGFQERGKSVQTSFSQRRMIRQRLPIEAFISLGKRKFGWNRCRARNPEYESSWISFAASALNAYKTFWIRPPP